jgi:SAM-dependent methyltransferase
MLRDELGLLPAHAARQPSGRALLLQPDLSARELPVDLAHLAPMRLHANGEALSGDVVCAAGALPMEDESFQLVFAQHVGDVQPLGSGPAGARLVEEIARVLAPGGLLLWSGFNPWSPWLAWIRWHTRRGGFSRPANADALRRRLARCQLTPVALEYLGTCWPRRSADVRPPSAASSGRLSAPLRGTYLIAARKQRAVLTPLRPRAARTGVGLAPRLAGTPSQRACA